MIRCGELSQLEAIQIERERNEEKSRFLSELAKIKRDFDDAQATIRRNPGTALKFPVDIFQAKIDRGLEIIQKMGDSTSSDLYGLFFTQSYPKFIDSIREKQAGICPPGKVMSGCIECQKRCEFPLYQAPPECESNIESMKCTSGCVCQDKNMWMMDDMSCSSECDVLEVFNSFIFRIRLLRE